MNIIFFRLSIVFCSDAGNIIFRCIFRCRSSLLFWQKNNSMFVGKKMPTAWKVSKYGVFSCLCFPAFGTNTEIYSEYRTIRIRKNSVFGHFSRSDHLYRTYRKHHVSIYVLRRTILHFATKEKISYFQEKEMPSLLVIQESSYSSSIFWIFSKRKQEKKTWFFVRCI